MRPGYEPLPSSKRVRFELVLHIGVVVSAALAVEDVFPGLIESSDTRVGLCINPLSLEV